MRQIQFIRRIHSSIRNMLKPTSSEVLTSYIMQCNEPPWTSYFVKYSSIRDDQWGKSHFNWNVGGSNYHILRTGCFPYIKYHCTKRNLQNLTVEDYFFRVIKVANLGGFQCSKNYAELVLLGHCFQKPERTECFISSQLNYPKDLLDYLLDVSNKID